MSIITTSASLPATLPVCAVSTARITAYPKITLPCAVLTPAVWLRRIALWALWAGMVTVSCTSTHPHLGEMSATPIGQAARRSETLVPQVGGLWCPLATRTGRQVVAVSDVEPGYVQVQVEAPVLFGQGEHVAVWYERADFQALFRPCDIEDL